MKELKLSLGLVALVDDCCYDYLSQWHWIASKKANRSIYAQTSYSVKDADKRIYVTIYLHRHLLENCYGYAIGGGQVDHIDHNGLNNQLSNLRIVTRTQNQGNRFGKGCSYRKDKSCYEAYIHLNNKKRRVGYYDTEQEAIAAYQTAHIKQFGQFSPYK